MQGSAADVAAAAMVAIHKSEELRQTGFKLLMQVREDNQDAGYRILV